MPRVAPVLATWLATTASLAAETLIVLNKADSTAMLIDSERATVVATLPTGVGPHEVDVTPSSGVAVVTNYGRAGAPGSTLTTISMRDAKVVKTIDLGAYQKPHGIVAVDDKTAYVTAEAQRAVLAVDLEAGRVVKAVETGQDVSHMLAPWRHAQMFVSNIGSGSVSVVSFAGDASATIPTGRGTEGIAVLPDGSEVWVTNREDGTVSVIDPRRRTIVATLRAGAFPIRAKATPDGRRVLVSNARSGDLSVVDVKERKEVRRIRFDVAPAGDKQGRLLPFEGPIPIGIAVARNGKRAYVALSGADVVAVIDLQRLEVIGRLPTGKEPDGIGVWPAKVGR